MSFQTLLCFVFFLNGQLCNTLVDGVTQCNIAYYRCILHRVCRNIYIWLNFTQLLFTTKSPDPIISYDPITPNDPIGPNDLFASNDPICSSDPIISNDLISANDLTASNDRICSSNPIISNDPTTSNNPISPNELHVSN